MSHSPSDLAANANDEPPQAAPEVIDLIAGPRETASAPSSDRTHTSTDIIDLTASATTTDAPAALASPEPSGSKKRDRSSANAEAPWTPVTRKHSSPNRSAKKKAKATGPADAPADATATASPQLNAPRRANDDVESHPQAQQREDTTSPTASPTLTTAKARARRPLKTSPHRLHIGPNGNATSILGATSSRTGAKRKKKRLQSQPSSTASRPGTSGSTDSECSPVTNVPSPAIPPPPTPKAEPKPEPHALGGRQAATPTQGKPCCNCKKRQTCNTNRCPCKRRYRKCCTCPFSAALECPNCPAHARPSSDSPAAKHASSTDPRAPKSTPAASSRLKSASQSTITSHFRPRNTPTSPPKAVEPSKLSGTVPRPSPPRQPNFETAASLPSASPPATPSTQSPRSDSSGRTATKAPKQASPASVTPEEEGDPPGATVSAANLKPDTVYGDHIHDNPGNHLTGGIADDSTWQDCFGRLVPLPPSHCKAPRGAAGTECIKMIASSLNSIVLRECNSEKLLVFQMVMPQRTPAVKRAGDIKRRLKSRMEQWKAGLHRALAEDTIRTMEQSLFRRQSGTTPEHRAQVFDSKVKRGDLRSAVRCITDREGGGVLEPEALDAKTGKTVIQALKDKHPSMREPGDLALPTYESLPEFLDIDITEDTVEQVASRLTGCAGLSGIDSTSMKHMLLLHGTASRELRQAVANFTCYLSNDTPPWASCRGFQWCRLIALDKNPGIRPIGIGDIWRRLFAKCNLAVTADEAKAACGSDQLCAGPSAGIEGAIHGMRALWNETEAIEDYGFLLADARNAFDELSRISMLWTARHEWPSGSRFLFNCYKHHSTLVCRAPDGSSSFVIHSKEGVTQGDPLAMIGYGMGILPLARRLASTHIDLRIPWYADDSAAAGTFVNLELFFDDLSLIGPQFGYFPEPSKSILIARNATAAAAADRFFNHTNQRNFEIKLGHRYLGGFIGDEPSQQAWLAEMIREWADNATTLADVAQRYPQTAFAGLQKSLQHRWGFIHRVLPGVDQEFQPVEDALSDFFLPSLFGDAAFEAKDYRRDLTALPMRHGGLSIPNPTKAASLSYDTSTTMCSHLLRAVQGKIEFSPAEHDSTRRIVLKEQRLRADCLYESQPDTLIANLPNPDGKHLLARAIRRAGQTGSWLSVMPSTTNGTESGCDEFRDSLRLRYGCPLDNLPATCDGCGAKFTLEHATNCKAGGLIIQRHNEINEELAVLASLALKKSSVHAEPLINPGMNVKDTSPRSGDDANQSSPPEVARDRGDLLIRGLWKNGTDCVVDVRVTDLDAPSYNTRDPEKVPASHEQQKKKKCLDGCLHQRRSFVPFIVSTDGLMGREASTLLKQISKRLAEKWNRRCSVVCSLVRSRISVACIRASQLCLRGSRIPFSTMSRRLQWNDGSGFNLFTIDRDQTATPPDPWQIAPLSPSILASRTNAFYARK